MCRDKILQCLTQSPQTPKLLLSRVTPMLVLVVLADTIKRNGQKVARFRGLLMRLPFLFFARDGELGVGGEGVFLSLLHARTQDLRFIRPTL